MLLHRWGIELTAARSARNQLADLAVLCRLVLVFVRISVGILWHSFHGLTFVLVKAVCNSSLLFATEWVLFFIEIVPFFAVTITRRQDFIKVVLGLASVLKLRLYRRFVELPSWLCSPLGHILFGLFDTCLLASHFVAVVYRLS